ncbi:hypothetical protein ACH4TX_02775 [Streptomyces sp. NPDC021098]|uniref:hypothetical protein n=1 Tax=unclassified Streptomyces TaxID=2593676 RepID=UPI0037AB100A
MHSSFISYASAVAAGVIVGICGPLFASAAGGVGNVVHVTFSSGWSWAALAFCLGMMGESKKRSTAIGVISLVVAVLSYYLAKAGQGDFETADLSDKTGQTTYFSWGDFLSMSAVWCFFACLLGAALGVAGNMARNGPYSLPCRLVVPFVAIVECSMRLRDEGSLQTSIVTTTWSVTRVAAAAIALVLVAYSVVGNWRRRSARRIQV